MHHQCQCTHTVCNVNYVSMPALYLCSMHISVTIYMIKCTINEKNKMHHQCQCTHMHARDRQCTTHRTIVQLCFVIQRHTCPFIIDGVPTHIRITSDTQVHKTVRMHHISAAHMKIMIMHHQRHPGYMYSISQCHNAHTDYKVTYRYPF